MDGSFVIKRFDIKKLNKGSIVVLVGKRKVGKSFMIKDILYHKKDEIPAGLVISKTEHVTNPPFFGKFIPRACIHKNYNPAILKQVFERQIKGINWPNREFFVVMDDCISDASEWKKDKYIEQIFFEGRHSDIFYILSMQDPMAIPPGLRSNIDYLFIHKTNNKKMMRQIYENYVTIFDNFKTFELFLSYCTEDHKVMVIDMNSNSSRLEDNIFYYKAEPHDNLKLFSEDIWKKSDEMYRNANNISNKAIVIKNKKKF